MKRVPWWIGLICVAVLVVGCGPSEPAIEKPAAEMNLTLEDVGEGFTLEEEFGLEEALTRVQLEEASGINDANLRVFASSDAKVLATTLQFASANAAQSGMNEFAKNLEAALQEAEQGLVLEDRSAEAPAVGDDAIMFRADTLIDGNQIYLFGFRKVNVVSVLVASGSTDLVDDEWVRGFGLKMAGRIPQSGSGD
jgi:hypothetical protein